MEKILEEEALVIYIIKSMFSHKYVFNTNMKGLVWLSRENVKK